MSAELLDLLEVGAVDLDADGGAHAGREHVDSRLDRHGPGIGHSRELQRPIHFRDQVFLADVVGGDVTQRLLQPLRRP